MLQANSQCFYIYFLHVALYNRHSFSTDKSKKKLSAITKNETSKHVIDSIRRIREINYSIINR
jgi:hypothetical protein